MKKLAFLVLLTVSCGSDNKAKPDAPVVVEIDAAVDAPAVDCFQGTPTTHDQLLNACVDQSVTRIVKYPSLQSMLTALPKLNPDGTVPALP